ncbi:MAG: cbb3-type cytochrome c oxidase subunit I [Bacteroidetes bacterium]|nr:cbb3-type cytochrome c oxidase subunit I [Bacteroidota bacterium]
MDITTNKKTTLLWLITVLVVFLVAIIFGLTMRMGQAELVNLNPVNFYVLMTSHGLLMIGVWYVAGMAGIQYLMSRYLTVPRWSSVFAYVCTILGIVVLLTATFFAKFHASWYFLYPLPFLATGMEIGPLLFFIALTILGVGWLVWSVVLVATILKKYTIVQALGWHHLAGKTEPAVSPFILISFVSIIGVICCLLAAVVLLVLYYIEMFSKGAFTNDPLLMKNLTFFFGHTIANEMLYMGLAVLYELFPGMVGKPAYKSTWYVVLAWNATLLIVLFAYFHHLYMDFAQPLALQYAGQIITWLAPLPSVCVTIFSVLVTLYGSKMKWSLASLLYFFGVMFWVIGGMGALLDAVIANNFVLHNTQWVPAHFHTYNLLGNVFFSLAFASWFADEIAPEKIKPGTVKIIFSLLVIGGVGFLLAFYLGGALSVPRKVNMYNEVVSKGISLAQMAVAFASLYFLGMIIYTFDFIKRCVGQLFS